MSHEYVITSKEVRPDFTARLFYDDSPENPRKWGAQVTSIYFWDDKHEDLSDSRDIRSYQEALHDLYQKTYPELVDLCLEDEPPQEVLDLIEQTPYPGIVRWIRVLDTSMETSLVPVTYPDTEDPHIGGVAFISDEKLQKEQFTREEGDIIIQNDLLELEQYINGNICFLEIQLDGDEEYHGSIYPLAQTDTRAGRMTLMENTHIPREKDLDDHLLDMDISPEDRLLVSTASWE